MFVPSSNELIIEDYRIKISAAISQGDFDALGKLLQFFKKHWLLQTEQLFEKDLLTQALVCNNSEIFYRVLHFCADPEINQKIPNFLARQLSPAFLENVRQQGDSSKNIILKIFVKLLDYCQSPDLLLATKKAILTIELCTIMSDFDATLRENMLTFFSQHLNLLTDGVLCPVILMSIIDHKVCNIRAKQTTCPSYQQDRITPMTTLRASLSALNSSDIHFEQQLADIVKNKTYEQLSCFQEKKCKKILEKIQYACGVHSSQMQDHANNKNLGKGITGKF